MWKYEKGDQRYKHTGRGANAVFEQNRGVTVGKCPNTITLETAQKILNEGVGCDYVDTGTFSYPRQMFGFHEGVLYKALPTRAGISYHAFPACSDDLSPPARQIIFAHFSDPDTQQKIQKWLTKADKEIRSLE